MNKYPYYVSAYIDAGILRKIFNDKKFKTYNDAVNTTKDRCERFSKFWKEKNLFFEHQVAIIEYTQEYKGHIVTLFTNGNEVKILEPQVLE